MPDRLLAEYNDEDAIVAAIHRLHREGYRRLEAFIPFPSHAIEAALGEPPSRLPYVIFAVGIAAAAGAYGLQWLLVAHLYPLIVGGRPPHFPLAFLIITFEMGVLFSALAAFFGTLAAGKLVRLVDDVQGTPGFESVTRDCFWLEISMRDPAYDEDAARRLLVDCGAVHVTIPEATP
jgi:hypothetical protein